MNIVCLFIVRHSEPSTPELLVAWDEYTIDGWEKGWKEACHNALVEVGSAEILSKAYVTLSVREQDLMNVLLPAARLRAEIVSSEES